MKPYSLDLRQRVLQALQEGQTQNQIAKRFDVSLSTVGRYKKQWQSHSTLVPKSIPGKPRRLNEEAAQQLACLTKSRTDWTLATLALAWQDTTGQSLPCTTLHRYLRWLGFSQKKRAASPASATKKNGPTSKSR